MPNVRIPVVLAVVFALMLAEHARSRANERRLRARGAVEPRDDVMGWMRVAYPLAFGIPALEGWWRGEIAPAIWMAGLVVFTAGKCLKYWAITALGRRWSFKVLTLPGVPLVRSGPYRWMAHPNYVGVAAEIAGAALLTGGIASGTVFTFLFGWLMLKRIRVEDRELNAAAGGPSTL